MRLALTLFKNMQPENTIKCTCTVLLSCIVSFIPLYGHSIAMHLVHKSPTDAHVYVYLTYIIPYYYTITDISYKFDTACTYQAQYYTHTHQTFVVSFMSLCCHCHAHASSTVSPMAQGI